METFYSFTRLIPGTSQLQDRGEFPSRAIAEQKAVELMESDRHYGGIIVKHPSEPEAAPSVVAAAYTVEFEDFDDHDKMLHIWTSMTDEVRDSFVSGTADLHRQGPAGVPEKIVLYGRIGYYGPWEPELIPDFDRFLACIIGDPDA